jgi:integrase
MKGLSKREAATVYAWLRSSADPKDIALWAIFETGARVSELLGAVGGSLSDGSLDIVPLKGSLPRRVELSPGLAERLAPLLSPFPLGASLFPGAAKASWRRLLLRHHHARMTMLIGRRRPLKALRHTAMARVYSATGDLLLTRAWAGHVSVNSTLVYMEEVRQAEGSAANLTALGGGL